MTSALFLATGFGLNTIVLKRIWAIATKQNEKAIKLIEKLNFIKIADLDDDEKSIFERFFTGENTLEVSF